MNLEANTDFLAEVPKSKSGITGVPFGRTELSFWLYFLGKFACISYGFLNLLMAYTHIRRDLPGTSHKDPKLVPVALPLKRPAHGTMPKSKSARFRGP